MFGVVNRRLCGNFNSARTRDKANQKQKLLKVRERRVGFGCQISTSAAVNRTEGLIFILHVKFYPGGGRGSPTTGRFVTFLSPSEFAVRMILPVTYLPRPNCAHYKREQCQSQMSPTKKKNKNYRYVSRVNANFSSSTDSFAKSDKPLD